MLEMFTQRKTTQEEMKRKFETQSQRPIVIPEVIPTANISPPIPAPRTIFF